MASEKLLPAPPYKTPMINTNGLLSEPWSKWFRQMFLRAGGSDALSNLELQEGYVTQDEIDAVESSVSVLSLTVSGNYTELLGLIEGLQQGRQL